MKKKFATGLALIVVAVPALAADWRYITTSVDDSDYFIDATSLRDSRDVFGEFRMAWIKTEDQKNIRVKYRSQKLLYHIKCSEYQLKVSQWIEYDAEGRVLNSGSGSSVYRVAAPETIGSAIVDAACW